MFYGTNGGLNFHFVGVAFFLKQCSLALLLIFTLRGLACTLKLQAKAIALHRWFSLVGRPYRYGRILRDLAAFASLGWLSFPFVFLLPLIFANHVFLLLLVPLINRADSGGLCLFWNWYLASLNVFAHLMLPLA